MQSVFRLILLSTLGFVLAGCGTMLVPQKSGFSQQAALQDIPSSWTNSKQPYASGVQSLRSLTNDKALLAYIDQVLEQNISLRQSELAYQRAELERQKAVGSLLPSLTLSSTGERARTKSQQSAPGQKKASYANSIGLNASINWELDIWGKLADLKKAASAEGEASQQDLQAAKVSMVAQALRDGIELASLERLKSLEQSRITSLRRTEQIISDQFSRGLGELSDLEAARSATANAEASLEERKLAIAQLKRRMQIATNGIPTGKLALGRKMPSIQLPKGDYPAAIMGRRPDILAAFERAKAADSNHSASYKDMLPSFSITLTASDQAPNLSDLFSGGPAWRTLGSLTAPIFDGGTRRLTAKQAEIDAARGWLTYRQTVLDSLSEVENGLQSEGNLRRREAMLTRALRHSKTNLEQYERRYRDGLTDIVTLLSAERDAFTARQSLVNIRSLRLQNRVNLAVAFGLGL